VLLAFVEGQTGEEELMSAPIYFPQIGSGILTQYPYRTTQAFNSVLSDTPAGHPYGFVKRGSGLTYFPPGPLSRFELNYQAITDAEAQSLQTFFAACQGRLAEFIYLDAAGNLIPVSENFADGSWSPTGVTVGSAVTDPFGGTRATTLTATTSNSNLAPTVVPGGYLPAGFLLCASVYAKAHSAGQSLSIGFIDSGFDVLHSTTWPLPQNKWVRIYDRIAVATSSYIRVLIGGFGTWSGTAIDVFGPLCAPTGGPGAYTQSPVNYGYHPHCRFDTDFLSITAHGPNQNGISLPVTEYYSS
jgi:hypothetical protein